jgi:N-acetylated-alpha-linked acidic dipeptidase
MQESIAVFGYADFTAQAKIEEKFLAVPDAKLAGEHLKTLTAEPHLAATPEDRKTAEYVARKFRAAGLETEIVPYRVLLNQPKNQGCASRPTTRAASC